MVTERAAGPSWDWKGWDNFWSDPITENAWSLAAVIALAVAFLAPLAVSWWKYRPSRYRTEGHRYPCDAEHCRICPVIRKQ